MRSSFLNIYWIIIVLVFFNVSGQAQIRSQPVPGTPATLQNAPGQDTTGKKTNTNEWRNEDAHVSFKRLNSRKNLYPDTSIHHFHRRPFMEQWNRDLGNPGSPIRNLLFTPEYRVGPSLGYHAFDAYRFFPDSLAFYHTYRPYSVFKYQLGSRAEQIAEILHTQNIQPNWNVAAQYRKINSPGNYKIQRTNPDFGNLTTNYKSRDQHYQLYGALVYNKIVHDENGGIVADSFLDNESFGDRKTIPVNFQRDQYSIRRSSVTNLQRDFTMLLLHHYTIGKRDTIYNEDSTKLAQRLVPRFRITHKFQLSTEKYQFKDVFPDSFRYAELFNQQFGSNDSVFTEQKWFYVDNEIRLNGFLGKAERQLEFSAGLGIRNDQFKTAWHIGETYRSFFSNYITGEIKKEALQSSQWSYDANLKLFLTGETAGSFVIGASAEKGLYSSWDIKAGFEQRLNNAPYNYSIYQNQYYQILKDYDKETVTQIFGTIANDDIRLNAGVKNYLITNYIFINPQQQFDQYSDAFNITQLWLQKAFRVGIWVLDNEIAYQQKAGEAPVNIPSVMGRHQLSIETLLFGNALKIATGIDARWHSAYKPAGYSPFFNRFYFQDTYNLNNPQEVALFFNFKVKNFRAYIMGDQLQQMFTRNLISVPGYPLQDAMIRFGFNWVMVN